jgi:hypothetical protein
MSNPTTPAPLPVVACDIALWSAEGVATVHPYQHGDIPALAVPLALFEDDEFGHAVYSRVRDLVGYLATFEVLTAIAAELRARAGVPETNFGNVGGGA